MSRKTLALGFAATAVALSGCGSAHRTARQTSSLDVLEDTLNPRPPQGHKARPRTKASLQELGKELGAAMHELCPQGGGVIFTVGGKEVRCAKAATPGRH
jgi:hypothetical protein